MHHNPWIGEALLFYLDRNKLNDTNISPNIKLSSHICSLFFYKSNLISVYFKKFESPNKLALPHISEVSTLFLS